MCRARSKAAKVPQGKSIGRLRNGFLALTMLLLGTAGSRKLKIRYARATRRDATSSVVAREHSLTCAGLLLGLPLSAMSTRRSRAAIRLIPNYVPPLGRRHHVSSAPMLLSFVPCDAPPSCPPRPPASRPRRRHSRERDAVVRGNLWPRAHRPDLKSPIPLS